MRNTVGPVRLRKAKNSRGKRVFVFNKETSKCLRRLCAQRSSKIDSEKTIIPFGNTDDGVRGERCETIIMFMNKEREMNMILNRS